MAQLDDLKIRKLRRGEIAGEFATAFSALALIWFIVGFSVYSVKHIAALGTAVWSSAPPLLVIGVAAAAFCNLKYGGALDREVKDYVTAALVENARALHPEKKSLSFYITPMQSSVELSVNDFKEKVVFDFSALGKLTGMRKLSVVDAVERSLSHAFIRLAERGEEFTSVSYTEVNPAGKRRKAVPVITGGVPDKKALKEYYKNR